MDTKQSSDKEILDAIHINLHAVRLLPGYKPSEFEKKIALIVTERYSSSCRECKDKLEILNNPPKKKSIFSKLGEAMEHD